MQDQDNDSIKPCIRKNKPIVIKSNNKTSSESTHRSVVRLNSTRGAHPSRKISNNSMMNTPRPQGKSIQLGPMRLKRINVQCWKLVKETFMLSIQFQKKFLKKKLFAR